LLLNCFQKTCGQSSRHVLTRPDAFPRKGFGGLKEPQEAAKDANLPERHRHHEKCGPCKNRIRMTSLSFIFKFFTRHIGTYFTAHLDILS
jgi:hypothetical protein